MKSFILPIMVLSFLSASCSERSKSKHHDTDISKLKLNPECTAAQVAEVENLRTQLYDEAGRRGIDLDQTVSQDQEKELRDLFNSGCEKIAGRYDKQSCDVVDPTTITTYTFDNAPGDCMITIIQKDIKTELARIEEEKRVAEEAKKAETAQIEIDIQVTEAKALVTARSQQKPLTLELNKHDKKQLKGKWVTYPVGIHQTWFDSEEEALSIVEATLVQYESKPFEAIEVSGLGKEKDWDVMTVYEKSISSKRSYETKGNVHAWLDKEGNFILKKYLQHDLGAEEKTLKCTFYLSYDEKGLARGCTYKVKNSSHWGASINFFKKLKR